MKGSAAIPPSAWIPVKEIKPRLFPGTEPFQRPDRPGLPGLEDLASSMDRHGILCPIVVDYKTRVVSGSRRLQAAVDHLEWSTVPVIHGDFMEITRAMIAENQQPTLVLPMTLSEQLKMSLLLDELATPYRQLSYRRAAYGSDASGEGPTRKQMRELNAGALGLNNSSLEAVRSLREAYLPPGAPSGQKRTDANPDLARRIIEDDGRHLQQPYRARDLYLRALADRANSTGTIKGWREGMPALLGQLNALGIAIDGLAAMPEGLGEDEAKDWLNQLAAHILPLQQLKNRIAAYHEGVTK